MIFAALAALDHVAGDRLEREEESLDVDGEDHVETLPGHVQHRRHIENGGVVDQDIDGAALAGNGLHHRNDRVLGGNVKIDRISAAADRSGGRLARVGIAVSDDHGGALLGVALGYGTADAARAASDDGDFAVELHCRMALPS